MLSEHLVSVALHHIGGQVLSIFVYYKAFLTFNMATCMTTDSDSQGFIVDTRGEYLPVQPVPTQTRKQPRLPKSHYGTTFVHLHIKVHGFYSASPYKFDATPWIVFPLVHDSGFLSFGCVPLRGWSVPKTSVFINTCHKCFVCENLWLTIHLINLLLRGQWRPPSQLWTKLLKPSWSPWHSPFWPSDDTTRGAQLHFSTCTSTHL